MTVPSSSLPILGVQRRLRKNNLAKSPLLSRPRALSRGGGGTGAGSCAASNECSAVSAARAAAELYVEIREIDPLSVIVPISKIRKPYLPIGQNICNTLYRADVPSKKWFRIVFREYRSAINKGTTRGGPGTGITSSSAEVARGAPL